MYFLSYDEWRRELLVAEGEIKKQTVKGEELDVVIDREGILYNTTFYEPNSKTAKISKLKCAEISSAYMHPEKLRGRVAGRLYSLVVIDEETLKVVTDILNAEEEKIPFAEIADISKASDINEYMKKFNHVLKRIEMETDMGYKTKCYNEMYKQVELWKQKQINKAKETGEKQLIWFECGLPTEKKGSYVRKEYVDANGETTKSEGYQY